ncbi:MAG: hypothetical protein H7Z17_15075 [Fuerstia sp.]|nr:hypothetical protein [Fuerstiella sp.]
MINRRRALQSFVILAAAGTPSRSGVLLGSIPVTDTLAADETPLTLEEMLGETIELCRRLKPSPPESQRLCEMALARVQRSTYSSPAFWQACSDSVARLEVAVSRCEHTDSPQETTTAAVLYQLRSLRHRLSKQTVQVIGGLGRLASC